MNKEFKRNLVEIFAKGYQPRFEKAETNFSSKFYEQQKNIALRKWRKILNCMVEIYDETKIYEKTLFILERSNWIKRQFTALNTSNSS